LAQVEGGTVVALLRHIEQRQQHATISESTAVRYLKEMNFTFKHYRYSLKKGNQEAFDRAGKVIGHWAGSIVSTSASCCVLTNQVSVRIRRCMEACQVLLAPFRCRERRRLT
jgi:hypothetical protein